jgi:hypothetical protein
LGGIGNTLSGLTWLYLLGAGYTVYQLSKNWRKFWGDSLSPASYQLAVSVAFFLLVPVGVLLHEFGHMLAAWSTGSRVLGLHYFIYWGYVQVQYAPSNDIALLNLIDWYVALAGNFVSYLLGIACIVAALRLTNLKAVLRVVLIQLGILELVQTLIIYPLMSLDPSFVGDWSSIYSFHAPVASWATLVVHVLSLAGFVWLMRVNKQATYLSRGY